MGICIRYMGYKEADDVFQEVFMRIYEKIGLFKGNASLKTWLRHLVVNHCIDVIRKNKKYKETLDIEDYLNTHSDIPDQAEEEGFEMTPEMAMEFMQQLPEKYRLCLNLFAIEKYNYHQIGEMLNMNENTCRGNVSKGREMLREMLTKKKIAYHEQIIAS